MKDQLIRGTIHENSILVLFLGLCPALAVSTTAINGLVMGVLTSIVLVGSNGLISLLREHTIRSIRLPVEILIIASFVTAIKILMKSFLFELYQELGVFISLIVVNCIILGRAEQFASRNNFSKSLLDGLSTGIGFTLTLTGIACLRELLSQGTLTFAVGSALSSDYVGFIFSLHSFLGYFGINYNQELYQWIFFSTPAGGFIIVGLLIGLFNQSRHVFIQYFNDNKS